MAQNPSPTASYAMLPLMSQEQWTTAVEMVCYFFTAMGVALSLLMARR
jgi:hypothetical protein